MEKGFGIVEIIVAIGIFLIIAVTGISTIVHSFSIGRLSNEENQAIFYTAEGLEAARSIKNQDWNSLAVGSHGANTSSGYWQFSGSSNTNGKFTRQIVVLEVQRDSNGNIVSSGGTVDNGTRKVTSTTTWSFAPTRNNTISLIAYLTNWAKSTFAGWNNPTQQSSLDLSGGQDAYAVRVQGDYAYVITNSAADNFFTINISNLSSLNVASVFSIDENPYDIAVSGNYAYGASKNNSKELQILDISNPSSTTLASTFNASGNPDAFGIYLSGSYIYLVRASSTDDEFVIVNVSNPTSPSFVSSLNLGDTGNEVVVLGNYAYVATSSDTAELQVIDVTNPSSPSVVGSYNIIGTSDGLTIIGFDTTVMLGSSDGYLYFFDVTTPTSPQQLSSFNAGGNINDVDFNTGNTFAVLGTSAATKEFQVIDISTLTNPTLFGSLDVSDVLYGVDYEAARDRIFAVGASNSEELVVYRPQ